MYFDVKGKQVFATTGGKPFDNGKPAIIFLHGSGLDHTFWGLHSRFFAFRGYAVLVPDLPGHTNSEGAALTTIESMAAWLQDVAWKATTDRPLHADFLRIDLDKPWETAVEVSLLGHPAGLSKGGALIKDNLVIKVSALPKDLPEGLEIDISKLDAGDAIRAKDLALPDGVSLAVDPELYICRVTGGK